MTPTISATVEKAPKPKRPTLYIVVCSYRGKWVLEGMSEVRSEAEVLADGEDRAVIVIAPGETEAP